MFETSGHSPRIGERPLTLLTVWRRERDSNPRYGVNPYNALAGRPLRPLGHLSGRAEHYITPMERFFLHQAGWSSPNALCSARTASSMYFSSITTEILISEVEIIWMLMPSSARVRNIWLAMPACVLIATPTTETLQIFGSPRMSAALMWSLTCLLSTSSAFWYSFRCTVNDKSVMPSTPAFWMIMSTSMLASPIGPRMA